MQPGGGLSESEPTPHANHHMTPGAGPGHSAGSFASAEAVPRLLAPPHASLNGTRRPSTPSRMALAADPRHIGISTA